MFRADFVYCGLDGFNAVLAKDPNDLNALKQVASIHRNIKMYDQAKADENKIIALDPKDAEANYTVGSIDWNMSTARRCGLGEFRAKISRPRARSDC